MRLRQGYQQEGEAPDPDIEQGPWGLPPTSQNQLQGVRFPFLTRSLLTHRPRK